MVWINFFQFPGIRNNNNNHRFVRLIIQGRWNWPISCPNDSETQVRGLKGVKNKSKKFHGEACPLTPLETLGNRTVFILYPCMNLET